MKTANIIAKFTGKTVGASNFYSVKASDLTPALVAYFEYKCSNSPDWCYKEGDNYIISTPDVGGDTIIIEEKTSRNNRVYAKYSEFLTSTQRIALAREFRASKRTDDASASASSRQPLVDASKTAKL